MFKKISKVESQISVVFEVDARLNIIAHNIGVGWILKEQPSGHTNFLTDAEFVEFVQSKGVTHMNANK